MKKCEVCGADEKDRPSIFRNEPFCSDLCKKVLNSEMTVKRAQEIRRKV